MASVSLQFGSRRGRKRAALRDVLCLPIDSLFVNTQSSSSSLLSPSVGRSLTRVGRAHKLLVLSIKTRMHTQTHTSCAEPQEIQTIFLCLLKIKMETSGAHGT
jgi:hypothetical protein